MNDVTKLMIRKLIVTTRSRIRQKIGEEQVTGTKKYNFHDQNAVRMYNRDVKRKLID